MEHSEQVSQFKREHLSKLESLDLATKSILDAVADRRDVFQAAHEVQIALTEVQESTTRNINDTRQEIIQEMRVLYFSPACPILYLFALRK